MTRHVALKPHARYAKAIWTPSSGACRYWAGIWSDWHAGTGVTSAGSTGTSISGLNWKTAVFIFLLLKPKTLPHKSGWNGKIIPTALSFI